jgi:hypothetical protein
MNIKKHLIIVTLVCCSAGTFAQGFKDRFFNTMGFSLFADYKSLPLRSFHATVPQSFSSGDQKDVTYDGKISTNVWNLVTYIYEPRLNIVEFGSDASISLNVPIQFGLSFNFVGGTAKSEDPAFVANEYDNTRSAGGNFGMLTFSFPMFIQGNINMGSTYNSDKNNGFTLGLGFDQGIAPLVLMTEGVNDNMAGGFSKYYIMPAMNVGFNFFSKADKAHQVNFMFCYSGSESVEYVDTSKPGSPRPAGTVSTSGFGFQLSYRSFIGY